MAPKSKQPVATVAVETAVEAVAEPIAAAVEKVAEPVVVPAAKAVPAPAAKPVPTGFPAYEKFADLSRDNIVAMIKANAALTQGLEAISKEMLGYAKKSFESATQTATALLAAKSFDDVIEVNGAFAKSNLETMVERSAKLRELGAKVASDAMAPLGSRFEVTLATLAKPIAA